MVELFVTEHAIKDEKTFFLITDEALKDMGVRQLGTRLRVLDYVAQHKPGGQQAKNDQQLLDQIQSMIDAKVDARLQQNDQQVQQQQQDTAAHSPPM